MGRRIDMEWQGGTVVRQFAVRHFPKYLVFYQVIEEGIAVERVAHGIQNLPLLLND